jgi:hypothetical protein
LSDSSSDKIYETIKKIIIKLREILEENPDYCGSITINFYKGGISDVEKKESIKIK